MRGRAPLPPRAVSLDVVVVLKVLEPGIGPLEVSLGYIGEAATNRGVRRRQRASREPATRQVWPASSQSVHGCKARIRQFSFRPLPLFGLRQLDHHGIVTIGFIAVDQPVVIALDFILFDFVGRERNIIQHVWVEERGAMIALIR